jgi:hypothetical protein
MFLARAFTVQLVELPVQVSFAIDTRLIAFVVGIQHIRPPGVCPFGSTQRDRLHTELLSANMDDVSSQELDVPSKH